MKQIFRCEYCDQMGTAEEITKHEDECISNYNKRSCMTCKYANRSAVLKYKCACDRDIPEGKYMEQCPQYEWDGKDHASRAWNSAFGGLFGGIL